MEKECAKCGYSSEENSILFGYGVCSVCKAFAPKNEELFEEYVNEKVDGQELESFRENIENLNSNQKSGMIKKAKTGRVMSRAPFGYEIVENNLVKAQNSSVVENIFLDFQNNEISLNKLARKYGFSVNGIKKILRNFTYLGKIKFNGEVHEGNHEPLVSSTVFNHVQDKLERLGIKN